MSSSANAYSTQPWPWPRWLAHRGAGKLAPENTLAAFRVGARYGFRAFECDVKLSADGQPFLLHDATLERTTSGQGRAADQPWGALACLDAGSWHSRAYAGEPPASLAAIARFCLRNGFALNLEIKPSPGEDERTGHLVAEAVRRLWGAEVAAGRASWPLLSSFRPLALLAAQAAAPDLPRALLVDQLWTAEVVIADGRSGHDGRDAAEDGSTPARVALAPASFAALRQQLQPGTASSATDRLSLDWRRTAGLLGAVACVFNHNLLDAAFIAGLQAQGLKVLAYTVNDPQRAEALLAAGLDGVITDAVDLMPPAR